ncbi:hypothetical protein FSOLCH5_001589 [Fusarium solani]
MASHGGNMLSLANAQSLLAGVVAAAFSTLCLTSIFSSKGQDEAPGLLKSFFLFFYSSFIKPHQGDSKGNQQDALESFYKKQAGAYDATRKVLLRGREDMLALVAAQLEAKLKDAAPKGGNKNKRIWVDIGGGTGFNIEAMAAFVDVARKRFERLGWKNVKVVCEDARKFRLEDYESGMTSKSIPPRSPALSYFDKPRPDFGGADLITMSYSLSMIGDALTRAIERSAPEIRSKAFLTAVQNLSSNLPLPSFFYQNHHWRIYYDDQLAKHTQFKDEYIYAFTWEDTRVDERLLKLGADDKVLAITSAGDNILSYLLQSPARVHAVDLNPTQNHLLELKAASYTALPYEDFWKIFGDGKHPHFRELLITKLSPHLSGRAFQYWLKNVHVFQNSSGYGLYDTGGSRHAIRVFRWIARIFGLQKAVKQLLEAKTLNEQREIWRRKIRPALLSKLVCNLVVSQESFLWAALGVPKNQLAMIEADHAESDLVKGPKPRAKNTRSHAIWHYMVNTLDPVAEETHIAADNPYYYVCMDGKFSPKCHPDYLSPKAHAKLSRPNALDGLRIHTDELEEVIARITPGTLTVAVVMDSMDWFDTGSRAAAQQITKLNRALQMGGRVLLRSSALTPWYIKEFEAHGFTPKRHGARTDGACIDRVNMYASCWICTKSENLPPPTPEMDRAGGSEITSLTI